MRAYLHTLLAHRRLHDSIRKLVQGLQATKVPEHAAILFECSILGTHHILFMNIPLEVTQGTQEPSDMEDQR